MRKKKTRYCAMEAAKGWTPKTGKFDGNLLLHFHAPLLLRTYIYFRLDGYKSQVKNSIGQKYIEHFYGASNFSLNQPKALLLFNFFGLFLGFLLVKVKQSNNRNLENLRNILCIKWSGGAKSSCCLYISASEIIKKIVRRFFSLAGFADEKLLLLAQSFFDFFLYTVHK